MPAKTKKTTPSKTVSSAPSKKYVVEEKAPDEEIKTPQTSVKEDAVVSVVQEPEKKTDPDAVAVEPKIELPVSDAKPESKLDLANEKEKDTIPSAGITSFSLLDSKEKDTPEKIAVEETNKTNDPPVQDVVSSVANPVKSSQEEVNKWIENYDDKELPEKKKGVGFFKIFLIILTVLSLVAVIAGGVYYYQKNIAGDKTVVVEDVTENEVVNLEPTSEPTKAPEKEDVDYEELSLQILNGSGIPGAAGAIKDLLTDLEFKNVVTGNASNYEFEKTVISLKEDVPDQVFTDIKEAIKVSYDIEAESETLEDTSDYDVVITVGQKI